MFHYKNQSNIKDDSNAGNEQQQQHKSSEAYRIYVNSKITVVSPSTLVNTLNVSGLKFYNQKTYAQQNKTGSKYNLFKTDSLQNQRCKHIQEIKWIGKDNS